MAWVKIARSSGIVAFVHINDGSSLGARWSLITSVTLQDFAHVYQLAAQLAPPADEITNT